MKRRTYLKAASTSVVAGMAVLAGCSSGGGGSGGGGTSGGGNNSANGGASGGTTAAGGAGGATTAASGGSSGSATTNGSGGGSMNTGTGTKSTSGTNRTNGTSGSGGGETKTVGMHTEGSAYYFDPIGLLVEPGTTVTFEIESGAHSSTAYEKGNGPASVTRIPEDAKAWDSGVLSEGGSFDHTFETKGTYDYFCTPHKSLGMVGRIVVGSPGGPAESGMPPDGDVPKSDAIVKQGNISYEDFS